jgi:sulfite reductase alpha subunit-like flavoprotein
MPLFWLYLGQRHYWRDITYTAAWKRYLGLRVGRLFIGIMWVSRESVPVCEYVLPAVKPEGASGE